jgi:hypothetical protein
MKIDNNINKQLVRDISSKPLILKQTQYTTIDYEFVDRVDSFYMENNRKFVWLKQWRSNIYIYGNPFSSYSF